MLVYGDPVREVELHGVLHAIRRGTEPRPVSLDALREVLIRAGQLEQAIADTGIGLFENQSAAIRAAMILTDSAARSFVSGGQTGAATDESVRCIVQSAERLAHLPDVRLEAKVPEGFAFYALYPEQYCAAAAQWLDKHCGEPAGNVLVVGVRSIGTSLSSVVAAVLERGGWNASRITVRPTGHPFNRSVELHARQIPARYAIVVDEGPGLSGSSMAACAKALTSSGIAPQAISFFPGHDKLPSSAASAEIRRWWESTPRYVVPLTAIRWQKQSITDLLGRSTERLGKQRAVRIEDLSGGKWRSIVYPDQAQWPAVGATFERMKLRVVLEDSSSVLWKFAGLCDTQDLSRQAALAEAGFTAAPLAQAGGFVGMPWVEGERLTRDALDASLLGRIAAYIRAAARPPLNPRERSAAFDRVCEIVRVNVREALGELASERAGAIINAAAPLVQASNLPAYGDGRLAPHKWVRTRERQIIKLDCGGHDSDHTLVGPQSVVWDVAGTIVEWDMDGPASVAILGAMNLSITRGMLGFYELAYGAFRIGFCTICAEASESQPGEKTRLTQARERYLARVCALLA